MPASLILLLGGTEDAYKLAERLSAAKLSFISSLAGRTAKPRLPEGRARIGGFAAQGGLKAYIQRRAISAVIDATHPFAVKISAAAQDAAQSAAIPYLRLERAPWQRQKGDIWLGAADEKAAAAALPCGARAFLALGRQHLAPFAARTDCRFFARMIERPETLLPPHIEVILGRPRAQAEEEASFARLRLDYLVCRNSGSAQAYAKLAAARARGLPVILISRPQTAQKQGNLYFSNPESIVNFLLKSGNCNSV